MHSELKHKIQQIATDIHPKIVEWRRHFHKHPELSFKEYETSAFIKNTLSDIGIDYTDDWADTGVVATIKGSHDNKRVVALRADIDALPIDEQNDVPYKSVHEGVMHACGHDVHTSSLLGASYILHEIRDHIEGTVKIIFQPGEEKLPGGASLMIAEGVLEDPKPDIILGLHVHPPLEVGKVGFCPGMYMASADEIYVTVTGKGGHAALPQNCIDPILISSQILLSLQQLISRRSNPRTPSVLSFGKINSVGGATNIIPDEVKLEGTFRTFNEQWREEAHQIMKEQAEGIAKAMGGSCTFNIMKGYPHLLNDEQVTDDMFNYAKGYLGENDVVQLPPRMSAEDFAFYSHKIPACFFRIGTGNKSKNITAPVHTSNFDIDEQALEISAGLTAWFAANHLLQ